MAYIPSKIQRYECGGKKNFRCLMCGKGFSQGSHLKRHLESLVCTKYFFWETLKSTNQLDVDLCWLYCWKFYEEINNNNFVKMRNTKIQKIKKLIYSSC